MPEGGVRWLVVACALALVASVTVAAPGEDDLYRQIKVDVFDQNWPAVLQGCDQLLERFPASSATPQVTFHRARALSRIRGREGEASEAFRKFVARYPEESGLVEEAWSSIFSLACDAKRPVTANCAPMLREGLTSPSAYVSTLAAIRAADVHDPALQDRALPVLKRALNTQTDPDIVNEILIAILKIDPRQVPQNQAQIAAAASSTSGKPTLIKMTVYNKAEKRFDLKVNLPVAFARMLIDSLGEEDKDGLAEAAKKRGVDLDDIFDAIQKSGAGRFLDVDTPDSRIEIWIE